MMTDRSLNLVVRRVRVASDYWHVLRKLPILDALCGAELRMSADDQGTTASRAVRNILRCEFIRGLLRQGIRLRIVSRSFGSRRVYAPTPTRSPTISSPGSCFGCAGCRSSAKREDRVSAISPYLSSERRTRRQ